jgi:cbb3-type cytochrome oxidase subunit 3
MKRTVRPILIAALAIMQGIFGILRAFEFFRMGIYLSMRGILLLPVLGAVAFTWGKLVLVMALCYIMFALGELLNQRWAWGLGMGVSLVTGLVVLSLMLKGAADLWSLLWLIVPVILVWYLLSPVGRQEFRR